MTGLDKVRETIVHSVALLGPIPVGEDVPTAGAQVDTQPLHAENDFTGGAA